jgi:glycosyltransferase involved in cell wall biosynthesis
LDLQLENLDMTNKPLVSVIMIFLNAEEFLQEAVESVLAQTYENWEMLLVDDGSIDGSSEIARSYAARRPSQISYLEHHGHQNLGMSASRNAGIRNAKGQYFAFLDADDYWLPNRLETHVQILDVRPNVGMLYGTARYWYSWTHRAEDRERDFVPELRVKQPTLFEPPALLTLLLNGKAEVPCTCSILVRREVMQTIGGFEESFRGMYEDQALYAKVCLSTQVLATGDCLAWYRQHSKSHSTVVIESGDLFSTQYTFLKWLDIYCSRKNIKNANLIQTIQRNLWLNRNVSSTHFSALPPKVIYWLKKWILRLEEHVFPSKLRDWLWMRK